jgi:hypothetical protein
MKTGKLDINGKEMASGDVICFNSQFGRHEGEIYYDSHSASFRVRTPDGNFYLGGDAIKDHEIIKKKIRTNPTL